jgi:hypothetical protein
MPTRQQNKMSFTVEVFGSLVNAVLAYKSINNREFCGIRPSRARGREGTGGAALPLRQLANSLARTFRINGFSGRPERI